MLATLTLDQPPGFIAYDDRGSGPLVIMVPGLGDLRQSYRFLAPLVAAEGYRVVTVDLRGHGDSSTGWPSYSTAAVAGDVIALVEHLASGPAVVVGNSFAAAAAVAAAADRPELIAGIALIGPFVREPNVGRGTKLAMSLLFSGPWRVRAWSWYHGSLFPGSKPADHAAYRESLRSNLAEPGRFAAVKAMIDRVEPGVEERLAHVKAPSLVLMGNQDPDFPDPRAEATWVAEQLGGEFRMIEGSGHYPQADAPAETAKHLNAFLEGLR